MKKLGLYAWFGGNVSIDDRFKAIKEVGFDCVSLYWGEEYQSSIGKNSETIKIVQDKYHLEVENFHACYSNASDIFDGTDGQADELINIYINTIRDAKKYHVPVVVIHLTGDKIEDVVNPIGLKRLERVIAEARKNQVLLAFENLRKEGINHLFKVLETFKEKTVGFCYDVGHAHLFLKDDSFSILEKYKDRVYALHLHGNHQDWDYHKRLTDSNIDLNRLKECLKGVNDEVSLSLEVIQKLNINTYDELKEYLMLLKEDLKILL